MTYTPTIYQWPVDVAPIDQLFRAGGLSIAGGMTLGGAATENPEPGGRAELMFNFAVLALPEANKAMSWLASRMMNGAVLSVPIYNSVQLVPEVEIFGAAADNFVDTTDQYSAIPVRRWEPFVPVTAVALAGVETLTADLSELGRVLNEGHVIGFRSGAYDFAHIVTEITYDVANVATIKVSPPLRRGLAISDKLHLRPKMLVRCTNASEVATTFTRGRHMAPAPARLVEAFV
jgi:hypothetical protein